MKIIKIPNSNYSCREDGQILNDKTGRILKASIDNSGYRILTIRIGGVRKTRKISRLMGQYFLGQNKATMQINHKNGVKTDDRLVNLEWVTAKENIKHAFECGLMRRDGNYSNSAKLKSSDIKEIRCMLDMGFNQWEIAKKYGVTQSNISRIKTKDTWEA